MHAPIPGPRPAAPQTDPAALLRNIVAGETASESGRWATVSTKTLVLFLVGFFAFLAIVQRSEPGFVFLLDHANLLFHEAGHPITGLFSQRLEPYGGTVGQLFFPGLLMVSFWRKGRPIALAVATIWFFENFLNVARYMADARKLELVLVGGGDHDWNTIFARWDVLQFNDRIAAGINTIGWIGIAAALAWICWRAWHDREIKR